MANIVLPAGDSIAPGLTHKEQAACKLRGREIVAFANLFGRCRINDRDDTWLDATGKAPVSLLEPGYDRDGSGRRASNNRAASTKAISLDRRIDEARNLFRVTSARHSPVRAFVLRPFDCHLASGKRVFIERQDSVFRRRRLSTIHSQVTTRKFYPRTFRSPARGLNHPTNTRRESLSVEALLSGDGSSAKNAPKMARRKRDALTVK